MLELMALRVQLATAYNVALDLQTEIERRLDEDPPHGTHEQAFLLGFALHAFARATEVACQHLGRPVPTDSGKSARLRDVTVHIDAYLINEGNLQKQGLMKGPPIFTASRDERGDLIVRLGWTTGRKQPEANVTKIMRSLTEHADGALQELDRRLGADPWTPLDHRPASTRPATGPEA